MLQMRTFRVWQTGTTGPVVLIEAQTLNGAVAKMAGCPVQHCWGCGKTASNIAAFVTTDGTARSYHAYETFDEEN